jgi:hypothetical protein
VTRGAEPAYANPLTERERRHAFAQAVDPADNLVARRQRVSRGCKVAIDNVEVRPAHRARFNANAHFQRSRLWIRKFAHHQG